MTLYVAGVFNLEEVKIQFEDVPFGMEVHVDESGNAYNFGFGLNWNGVITDERTRKYRLN